MKNLYLFLFAAFLLMSCSDDHSWNSSTGNPEDANTSRIGYNNGSTRLLPNPELLQKVINAPGTAAERHLNFYPNGMLKNITNAAGTVLEHFTYSNGNLTSCFSGGATHTFTYDANNRITTVDGYPTTYNAATGTYTFTFEVPDQEDLYDYQHRAEITVNADGYLVLKKNFFDLHNEYHYVAAVASYQNGNLMGFGLNGSEVGGNYEFENTANPLKLAMAAASRAMALVNPENRYGALWINAEYTSDNNISGRAYQAEDPETSDVTYTYNSAGLPAAQTTQNYYNGAPDGLPYTSRLYYYQGDAIP